MKAIETAYRGYRFRSRLEARWAVFFDAIGVRWEYEKEGYDLDGVYYLPDFYLPEWDCWIEIKGEDPISEKWWTYNDPRLIKFSEEKLLIVFFGLPGDNYGRWYGVDSCDSGGGWSMWDQMQWCYDAENNVHRITTNNGRDRSYWKNEEFKENADIIVGYSEDDAPNLYKYDWSLIEAYRTAKQARFEHGERV